MPLSTTAWLMASVSVAFSAINPIQINNRLMALNIRCPFWCFGLLFFRRLLFLKQDFTLHDELELVVMLLFVHGGHNGRALLLHRIKNLGLNVEGDEMHRKRGVLGLR